jgi:hypothetical protein
MKSWDVWTAACTGTARCAAPVAAMQALVANPLLACHTILTGGGGAVQLLDLRSMKPVAAVVLPGLERSEQVLCFQQHGWDVVVGGAAGAAVHDLRALTGAAPAGAGGGRSAHERLRLDGHKPVSMWVTALAYI